MFKVLIVDDEVLVRIGLKNTIDWEAIGFTVVGEASNGEQGYAQYLKLEPDVVITDIKMPKQDGLWLTDKIHKDSKHTKILVLTCYDEFQYARTALKNGASDYMLKSEIVDDELIALMEKFKKELDDSLVAQPSGAVKTMNVNAVKRSLLNDLIKVKFDMDPALLERFEAQGFEASQSKYAFIFLQNKINNQSKSKSISETTLNLIIDHLNERGVSYLYNGYMDEHLFLLSGPDLTLTMLNRIANTIQNGVVQYFGIAINLIYTNAFEQLSELNTYHEKLMERVAMFFYVPRNQVYIENAEHVKIAHCHIREIKTDTLSRLVERIGQEDKEGTLAILYETTALFKDKHYPPRLLKHLMTQILGELYSVFKYAFDAQGAVFNYSGMHDAVSKTMHMDALNELLASVLSSVINELKYIRHNQSKHVIMRAINFVEHNYDQNISLEDVAKVVNLSKQYVCSLFKKETGQNLSTFINQIRIDKAKQLLLNPTVSSKDVFELVGYSNQQYFSRVFKKMTGLTTTEYKEQVEKNHDEV
ncbi:MAG TPA: hypothetical protein DCS67_04820 [Clostridiales bacterium UBA8960]|nr:hypothetical protein [Clostridiales bacterium UBA8960]